MPVGRLAGFSSVRRALLLSSVLPNLFRRILLAPFTSTYALPASATAAAAGVSIRDIYHVLAEHQLQEEEPDVKPGTPAFFLKLVVVLCLVLVGGALAGLTLAYMSMDAVNLTVQETSGEDLERARAGKVLKLIKKGQHWVLVTLLLFNTITNETLPIFLDSILGGGVLAVISSTALILLFGEVIPQAICSRYGLAIGAASTPLMTFLMYVSYPLSFPVAKLLDAVLGHDEGVTYKRAGLKTFVGLHRHLGAENLLEDEVTIISSVLELSEKSIRDIMVPVDDIYSLSSQQILDEDTVTEILRQGYSRVPVYQGKNKSNFIGMLLVKNLVVYDPEDEKAVSSFNLIPLPEAEPGMNCLEALNFFQQGRSHMLLVTDHPGEDTGALGIVSLEDVIEELIGEEIIDETDLFLDVANKIKVVRRPQIRTGAAKKLTPLLKDAANRRQAQGAAGGGGTNSRRDSSNARQLSRTNSEAGSDAPFSSNPPTGIMRDYGTLTANGGASTPRRRPSVPHRLGSLNSTSIAFDKVKIKGVSGVKKLEAMEAIRQNLEAIGSTVVHVEAAGSSGQNSGTATPMPQQNGGDGTSPSPLGNGASNSKSGDSTVTITATATIKDDTTKDLEEAMERDENAPLLGGKQIAGSPTGY